MGDQNHTKYTLLSLIVNVLNIYFKGMYCPPGEIQHVHYDKINRKVTNTFKQRILLKYYRILIYMYHKYSLSFYLTKGTEHCEFEKFICQIFFKKRKYQHPGIISIPGPLSAHWKKLHCFPFSKGHTKNFFPLLGPIFSTVLIMERLPCLQNGKDKSAH